MSNHHIQKAAKRIKLLQQIADNKNSEFVEPLYRPNRPLKFKNLNVNSDFLASFQIQLKLKFLWSHSSFTVSLVSSYYALNIDSLCKYRHVLNWGLIATNEAINWTEEMVVSFHKDLPTGLKVEEADQYCIECSENASFPWNEKIVGLFKERLNWDYLTQNRHFMSNMALVAKYWNFLKDYQSLIVAGANIIGHIQTQLQSTDDIRFPMVDRCINIDTKLTFELVQELSQSQPIVLWRNDKRIWKEVFSDFQNDEAIDILLSEVSSPTVNWINHMK
jgi:hypothetical protein